MRALTALETLYPIHPKFGWSQLQDEIVIKALFNIEDQLNHLYKAL